MSKSVLAITLTNAGGEGKTTWSEALAALARLGGRAVTVADIDPGNRGFLNRNGDRAAVSLDWAGLEYDAGDPAGWFERHVRGQDLTLLDTGANMLAAQGKTTAFLAGLLNLAAQNEVRVIFYCVTSPNKAGSGGLVELMYQRFARAGEIVIVQNDRDGSGDFKASLAQLGATIVEMPHLPAALQAVRLRRAIPLDAVLRDPEPDYERATAMIAAKLLWVARQPAIAEIVGEAAIAELEALSAHEPRNYHYTLSTLRHASNASLSANERLGRAWNGFRSSRAEDDAELLIVARELRAALTNWRQMH